MEINADAAMDLNDWKEDPLIKEILQGDQLLGADTPTTQDPKANGLLEELLQTKLNVNAQRQFIEGEMRNILASGTVNTLPKNLQQSLVQKATALLNLKGQLPTRVDWARQMVKIKAQDSMEADIMTTEWQLHRVEQLCEEISTATFLATMEDDEIPFHRSKLQYYHWRQQSQ